MPEAEPGGAEPVKSAQLRVIVPEFAIRAIEKWAQYFELSRPATLTKAILVFDILSEEVTHGQKVYIGNKENSQLRELTFDRDAFVTIETHDFPPEDLEKFSGPEEPGAD